MIDAREEDGDVFGEIWIFVFAKFRKRAKDSKMDKLASKRHSQLKVPHSKKTVNEDANSREIVSGGHLVAKSCNHHCKPVRECAFFPRVVESLKHGSSARFAVHTQRSKQLPDFGLHQKMV